MTKTETKAKTNGHAADIVTVQAGVRQGMLNLLPRTVGAKEALLVLGIQEALVFKTPRTVTDEVAVVLSSEQWDLIRTGAELHAKQNTLPADLWTLRAFKFVMEHTDA